MERLSPLDATFLHVEDTGTPMHIGAIAILAGPAPSLEAIRELVASKLPAIPRYRQAVRTPALTLGHPVWIDDPAFDLTHHVRRVVLPVPGGDRELSAVVSDVMARRLDRARPLWEIVVVYGLKDDRWALVIKAHHAMVDGVAGIDLLDVLLDHDPEATVLAPPAWTPERQPTSTELALRALAHRAAVPVSLVRAAAGGARTPSASAARGIAMARGLVTLAAVLRAPPATSLNGPVGSRRHWTWARCDLADVKAVRAAFGCKINDVVLALTTAGLRALLLARGDSCEEPTRVMVPVSLRRPQQRYRFDNRASAMFAELPVDSTEALDRLRRVKLELDHLKRAHEAMGTEALLDLAHVLPAAVLMHGLHIAAAHSQHLVATVATNVPGPPRRLYVAGRPVLELLPYVPIAVHVRTGVAILSYDQQIAFGVTGDGDDPDDLGVFTTAVKREIAELTAEAGRTTEAVA